MPSPQHNQLSSSKAQIIKLRQQLNDRTYNYLAQARSKGWLSWGGEGVGRNSPISTHSQTNIFKPSYQQVYDRLCAKDKWAIDSRIIDIKIVGQKGEGRQNQMEQKGIKSHTNWQLIQSQLLLKANLIGGGKNNSEEINGNKNKTNINQTINANKSIQLNPTTSNIPSYNTHQFERQQPSQLIYLRKLYYNFTQQLGRLKEQIDRYRQALRWVGEIQSGGLKVGGLTNNTSNKPLTINLSLTALSTIYTIYNNLPIVQQIGRNGYRLEYLQCGYANDISEANIMDFGATNNSNYTKFNPSQIDKSPQLSTILSFPTTPNQLEIMLKHILQSICMVDERWKQVQVGNWNGDNLNL